MRMYGACRSQIEVEYFGEVGVGLGPTLEFWTLISREMQNRSLNLFLDKSAAASIHAEPPGLLGLFPRPVQAKGVVSDDWQLLGTLIAKAMLDGRLLDLPLSVTFWEFILGRRELTLRDLEGVYPEAYTVLAELQRVCKDGGKYNGMCSIEDLGMSCTLIGRDDWELLPGGPDLSSANAQQYVDLSVSALLREGIYPVREAFRAGWCRVFPWEKLSLLTPSEIDMAVCGDAGNYDDEMWSVENLRKSCKADHGYDSGSRVVTLFFEVLATSFTKQDRKQFLWFVTGTPRLPIGGFAALSPRLTIVEKITEGRHADEELPSVMTCANYLKMSNYTSKAILEQRLRTAMESAGGFHMS